MSPRAWKNVPMNTTIDPQQITRYRMLTTRQTRIGHVTLNLLLAALVLIPFHALWGANVLWEVITNSMHWVVLVIFGSFYVHEALHALGFMVFAGVARKSIQIKMNWKIFSFETECDIPMTARSYRWSALLHGIVLGVIPAVVSLIYGYGWLALFSMLALHCAVSDVLQVWVIRDFKSSDMVAMIVDPTDPGSGDKANNVAST